MATHDDLDPLSYDWKSRGERATAVLREHAIEEAAGRSIPLEPLTLILTELAGSVSAVLQGLPERLRGLGLSDEAIAVAADVVADSCLQISVALDGAADAAMGAVDSVEAQLLGEAEPDPVAAVAGPKERAKRTHKGKPHPGNAKAKAPKAPGKKR